MFAGLEGAQRQPVCAMTQTMNNFVCGSVAGPVVRCMLRNVLVFVVLLGIPFAAYPRAISSYAFVNDDGTLRMRGKTIRLFGIIIPETDRTCRTFTIPPKCGPRAILQLDFKIGARFVQCHPKWRESDGTIVATCFVNDEDLSAWLLRHGWAAAAPDAPPEYVVLERIAQRRSLGIWGTPVDEIRRRRR
jgi:endonuclease YncB( thermonuclease family)